MPLFYEDRGYLPHTVAATVGFLPESACILDCVWDALTPLEAIISFLATQHTTLPWRDHGRFCNAGKVFTSINSEEKVLSCLGKSDLRSSTDMLTFAAGNLAGRGGRRREADLGPSPCTDVNSEEGRSSCNVGLGILRTEWGSLYYPGVTRACRKPKAGRFGPQVLLVQHTVA